MNNRTQFLTMRQNHNTASYRGANTHKKNPTELLGQQHYKFVNESKFDIIRTLSTPGDTGSGSYVILVKSKEDGYQYVLKVTGLFERHVKDNPNRPKHNFPELESKMYDVINRLVENNITPHVFMKVDQLPNIERTELPSSLENGTVLSYFKKKGIPLYDEDDSYTHCYAMLNETASEGVEITTLNKFLFGESSIKFDGLDIEMRNKILTNILFQILYTLEVFNRVGIIHNDLHFGNIFILIRPINILTPGYKKMNKTYTFEAGEVKHKVVLESIGIDVRIYDFDRSYKFPKPDTKYEDTMFCEKMSYFEDVNQCHHNTLTLKLKKHNIYFDTYKVLGRLFDFFDLPDSVFLYFKRKYTNFIKAPEDFIILIKSFFIKESLLKGNKGEDLMKGVVKDGGKTIDFLKNMMYRIYIFEYMKTKDIRYKEKAEEERDFYFLNNLPVGYMKTTEEMLVQMATKPAIIKLLSDSEEPTEFGAVENFDMKYINVDMVNNVENTLQKQSVRQAATKWKSMARKGALLKTIAKKSMKLPKTTRRRSMGNTSGSVRSGSVRRGSVRRGSVRGGSVRRGSVRRGSVRRGSIRSAPTKLKSPQKQYGHHRKR